MQIWSGPTNQHLRSNSNRFASEGLKKVRRQTIGLINIYQQSVSPYLGIRCRYEPTCSHYTQDAINKYGVIKGLLIGVQRLLKCHPFGGQGYDPVE